MQNVTVAITNHPLIYPLKTRTLATEKALDFCIPVHNYRSFLLHQNLHELLK